MLRMAAELEDDLEVRGIGSPLPVFYRIPSICNSNSTVQGEDGLPLAAEESLDHLEQVLLVKLAFDDVGLSADFQSPSSVFLRG